MKKDTTSPPPEPLQTSAIDSDSSACVPIFDASGLREQAKSIICAFDMVRGI